MHAPPIDPELASLRDVLQDDPEVLLAYELRSLALRRASFTCTLGISRLDFLMLTSCPLI